MSAPYLVAIVDDDVFLRDALDNLLRSAGFASQVFDSAESFLSRSCGRDFSLVVTDYRMPGMNGVELVAALRDAGDATPAIIMSGSDNPELERWAFEAGAVGFIRKPFDADHLIDLVGGSVARRPSDRNGAG